MTKNAVLTRKMDIMTADMDGDTVMMCVETGKYYNLGKVGGEIWSLLEQKTTFSRLIDALTEKYEVERETCARETAAFLHQIAGQGLVGIDEEC